MRKRRYCRLCHNPLAVDVHQATRYHAVCADENKRRADLSYDNRNPERLVQRRSLTCADCPTDISERGPSAKRCAPCAREWALVRKRANKRVRVKAPPVCKDCPALISNRGPSAQRCLECANRRAAELKAGHNGLGYPKPLAIDAAVGSIKKQRLEGPVLRATSAVFLGACERCGGSVDVTDDNYGSYLRCLACGWNKDIKPTPKYAEPEEAATF